jgi:hypothetical protein
MTTDNDNASPKPETIAPGVAAPVPGSVVFDGHLYKHPFHRAISDLCVEIEQLPGSLQQTKVVTMAGDLQHRVAGMRDVAAAQARSLRRWAAETFPPDANGQVHFARALMEGVADELDEQFNPWDVWNRKSDAEKRDALYREFSDTPNTSDQTPRVEPQ